MKRKKFNKNVNKKYKSENVIEKFFEILISTASVSKACLFAGISKTTVYKYIQNDPVFKKRFNDVRKFALCIIEDEALRRGVDGIDKDLYFHGEYIGTTKSYSDRLLIQLMRLKIEDVNNVRVRTDDIDPLSEIDIQKNNIINKL